MGSSTSTQGFEGARRPVARTRTSGVRVTEPEYLALDNEAWKTGKTIASWARRWAEAPLPELRPRTLDQARREPARRTHFCAPKSEQLRPHYALDNRPNKVIAAQYRTVLPAEKLIAEELERSRRETGDSTRIGQSSL